VLASVRRVTLRLHQDIRIIKEAAKSASRSAVHIRLPEQFYNFRLGKVTELYKVRIMRRRARRSGGDRVYAWGRLQM